MNYLYTEHLSTSHFIPLPRSPIMKSHGLPMKSRELPNYLQIFFPLDPLKKQKKIKRIPPKSSGFYPIQSHSYIVLVVPFIKSHGFPLPKTAMKFHRYTRHLRPSSRTPWREKALAALPSTPPWRRWWMVAELR